jgi:hypothetical protein
MPIPEVDALTPNSSPEQIKAATSSCIATEVNAGRDQQQAIAMCMQMIQEKTGQGEQPPAPTTPPVPLG